MGEYLLKRYCKEPNVLYFQASFQHLLKAAAKKTQKRVRQKTISKIYK
jgi:hypothetical protein